nr:sporulation protein YqfD [Pueribacillus theae]
MKNRLFHSLRGYVKAEIKGKYTELFLNRCTEKNIPIWSVKRVDDETISCFFYTKDIKSIRKLMRRTGCRMYFKGRYGFPFFLKKVDARKGFVLGLLFCLFIIFLCSNIIWSIQIKGASPEVEHKVRQALHNVGVKKGAFIFFLPSEQEIQQTVTEQLENVTWMGVKRLGTQYSFDVVEKKIPKEKPALNPRNLVAKKKAVIHKVFVEQGQAKVKEKDYVQKGQILVSGYIGKDENTKVVPAKGKIFGEVWYISEASVPLKTIVVTNTGKAESKHIIQLGKLKIPVWGFNKKGFKEMEIINDEKPIYFLKWKLPIAYIKQTMLEIDNVTRSYTKKEAVKTAIELTKKDLLRKLSEDAEIKGNKILQQKYENGKVNVMIHYQVIEEISKEQPIIQGD